MHGYRLSVKRLCYGGILNQILRSQNSRCQKHGCSSPLLPSISFRSQQGVGEYEDESAKLCSAAFARRGGSLTSPHVDWSWYPHHAANYPLIYLARKPESCKFDTGMNPMRQCEVVILSTHYTDCVIKQLAGQVGVVHRRGIRLLSGRRFCRSFFRRLFNLPSRFL